jgi:hypothetical protein
MNVGDLIKALEAVSDKSLPVTIEDSWDYYDYFPIRSVILAKDEDGDPIVAVSIKVGDHRLRSTI